MVRDYLVAKFDAVVTILTALAGRVVGFSYWDISLRNTDQKLSEQHQDNLNELLEFADKLRREGDRQ